MSFFKDSHRSTNIEHHVDNVVNDSQEVAKRLEHIAQQDNPFDSFVRSLLRMRKNGKNGNGGTHT